MSDVCYATPGSAMFVSFSSDVTKNYQTIKWDKEQPMQEHLTGLRASVEGQSDSLSMQPFIMQRLIIISRLLISH